MSTLGFNTSELTADWQQLEAELLKLVRRAEVEYRQAPAARKEQAGENYRQALARFSELVLDRRFPPQVQLQP